MAKRISELLLASGYSVDLAVVDGGVTKRAAVALFISAGSGKYYSGTVSSDVFGIGTTSPEARLAVQGTGETGAPDVAGDKSATMRLVGNLNALGAGGTLEFAGNRLSANNAMAAIKGFLTSGSGNTLGHLDFYVRAATTDTAMTLRMRLKNTGGMDLWMPTIGALRGVDCGAADSGGAGFRMVRVAN